jgi:hypothetical protein
VEEGGEADLQGTPAELGGAQNSDARRRLRRLARARTGKGSRGEEESKPEREREEGAGELIPAQAVGSGGDHLARIDGQSSARQLLVDRRRKMTRRWAGRCWASAGRGRERVGPETA